MATMHRGLILFLMGTFLPFVAVSTATAAVDLHIDGRPVTAGSAVILLDSGLGIASSVVAADLGVIVDEGQFPVIELVAGGRTAFVVVGERRAVVDGETVQLAAAPVVVDDDVFLPLQFVADMMNLRIEWDLLSGTLALHRADDAGGKTPVEDGPTVADAPDDQTPPSGAESSETTEPTDTIETSETSEGDEDFGSASSSAPLRAVATVSHVGLNSVDGHVQLEFVADEPIAAYVTYMADPARLVIDVPAARFAGSADALEGDGTILHRVRVAATPDDGLRFVADLTGATGYDLSFSPDERSFVVRLNHQLSLHSTFEADGGIGLRLHASGPFGYEAFVLQDPDRLVVDFIGVTIDGPEQIALDSSLAATLRLSQYARERVRAVFELADAVDWVATGLQGRLEPAGDGTVEFTLHPREGVATLSQPTASAENDVRFVGFTRTDEAEMILIETDGPVEIEKRRLREPDRLVLDMEGTRVPHSLSLVPAPNPPGIVGGVRAGQATADAGRVVIETEAPAEHLLLYSEDFTRAVLMLRPSGLAGRTIVVDAGHGGQDPGAIGAAGTREKDVTLAVAQRVARLLEQSGATVVMTRDGDMTLELSERVSVANALRADAFVSIHADAIGQQRVASGTSTFYFPENGNTPEQSTNRRYAEAIQRELQQVVGLPDRGVLQRRFHVVSNTRMPSALVEVGFIDNPEEEKLLVDPDFQHTAAGGIVQGIVRFFAEERGGSLPQARADWETAAKEAVAGFLERGDVPQDVIALVPAAVFGSVLEQTPRGQ